jgi:hypothetical protein
VPEHILIGADGKSNRLFADQHPRQGAPEAVARPSIATREGRVGKSGPHAVIVPTFRAPSARSAGLAFAAGVAARAGCPLVLLVSQGLHPHQPRGDARSCPGGPTCERERAGRCRPIVARAGCATRARVHSGCPPVERRLPATTERSARRFWPPQ